jgi:hypothetical protein
MIFEELVRNLPNGFHDVEIREIRFDLMHPSIAIGMNLHASVPGDDDPERYRAGTLRLITPYLFFIEPPDPTYHFVPDGSPINATGSFVKVGQNAQIDRLLAALPPNATAYLFFLDDWNACLYLAGANAEFYWDDGEALI